MTSDEFYSYLLQPELLNQQSLQALRELTTEHPSFEAAWVLYLKNLKTVLDPRFHDELKRAAIYVQDRQQLYGFLNQEAKAEFIDFSDFKQDLPAEEVLVAEPPKPVSQPLGLDYETTTAYKLETTEPAGSDTPLGELAGSLRKKPRKTKAEKTADAKDTGKSPANKGKPASSDDFVSETLAHIFARQGYYDKAIEVFEKLSLKFPEKNIYFAGQIEEVKKLKNNN